MLKTDDALKRARLCDEKGRRADNKELQRFHFKMRDSWIQIANHYEIIESIEESLAEKATMNGLQGFAPPSGLLAQRKPKKQDS